ncbi:MAG: dihydroorotase, partial [Candidatus Nanopelagicales bacterium]
RIGQVADQGRPLEVGEPAHIAVWDPRSPRSVTAETLSSRSRNSPFVGLSLPGAMRHVVYRGRVTVREGELQ